jgi:5-methylcytosine-specific restriction enzyme subunit McrC
VSIPIRNVYYLLLYYWDRVREGEEVLVGGEDLTELHDLLAHVLAGSVGRLISRGLDRDYIVREEAVAGVRGKLDLATTLKQNLLPAARTHCHFDELEYDVQHNRIIKATLRALMRLGLAADIRDHVRRLYGKMDAVSDVRISRRDFRTVQLHRNNRLYDFVLQLCLLIYENILIEEGGAGASFYDFRESDQMMGTVFERFVFNFLRREQPFDVAAPQIEWFDAQGSELDLGYLPGMQTDIVLRQPDRTLIIDAKFYRNALSGRWEQGRLNSSNLYQIFVYTENWAAAHPIGPEPEGMLLYPVVERPFSFDYVLKGRKITVRSINLDQHWQAIHADLLALIT